MSYYTKLSGVTFNNEGTNTQNRQVIIFELKCRGLMEQNQELTYQHEPWNRFDHNAIAVYGPDKRQIGYLPKEDALKVLSMMNNNTTPKIFVESVTGGIAGRALGVNLRIEFIENRQHQNDFYDELDMDLCLAWDSSDWNPHDLDEAEYENWLDSINE